MRSRLSSWLLVALLVVGCQSDAGQERAVPGAAAQDPPAESAEEVAARERAEAEAKARAQAQARLDAEYPMHAVVTGTELKVFEQPRLDAAVMGWLRTGARVRLGAEAVGKVRGCRRGFRTISPRGFVCTREGLELREGAIEVEPPSDGGWKTGQAQEAKARGAVVVPSPARDEPLPYDYYLVKETAVPSYHRLPSRDEQRAAEAKAAHFRELMQKDEQRALRYRAGELDTGPKGTEVTARYLEHKFFVSSNGSEVRAKRRFVRTIGGAYVKQSQLERYRARGAFTGVELGEGVKLPIAWTVRSAQPQFAKEREDGTLRMRNDHDAAPIERMTPLQGWRGLRRMGGKLVHEIETPGGTRYLKSWFAAVAREVPRPSQVPAGAPWVHVDLHQQTAVLYEGGRPAYATLVSTGLPEHVTPTGVFEIRRKRVTDTMADLGPEAGDDRYRIEDVPWTQYFEGSIALHAAFWHQRYGIPRSHGCVNLSPPDAHRIFDSTLPRVPEGWHGISTEQTDIEGSFVVVTDAPLGAIDRAGVLEEQADAEPEEDGLAEQAPSPTGDEGVAADRGPPDPRGIAARPTVLEPWLKRRPTEVRFTLTRERSARWVANFFRIPHGRMEALNEGLDLDKTLKPETELVVYRHEPEKRSRSVGKANRGTVEHGAPMPDGEGRILKAPRGTMWGTRRTVALLDTVLRAWARLEPKADPVLVGGMSLPKGGKLEPHQTHQAGRDVDLGYPQVRDPAKRYNWREMDARNLDVRRTWRLLHLLRATGELERVFIDRELQKILYEAAVQKNWLSDAQLAQWLEYPRAPGDGSPLVQHVAGHVDHLHVRFACGSGDLCD